MNTLRPPLPAQHAATQTSPLKLRTTSVPTTGRVFRAQEVNRDLLIELEGATIDEDPFTDDPLQSTPSEDLLGTYISTDVST